MRVVPAYLPFSSVSTGLWFCSHRYDIDGFNIFLLKPRFDNHCWFFSFGAASLHVRVRVLLREDLAAKVEYRQRARDADSFARSQDSQVPAADQSKKSEASRNVQKLVDVFHVGLGGGMRNAEVCGGDEREEHDETKEGESKECVDAESADEEHEACNRPVLR